MKKRWYSSALILLMTSVEGVTAIEYAIVLPILLLLIMGIVEYSLVLYASSVLEGAVTDGARGGKTGYTPTASGSTRASYVAGLINTRISGLLNPTKYTMVTKSYPDFASVGSMEPCATGYTPPCSGAGQFVDINGDGVRDDRGVPGLGSSSQIVSYTVTYPWTISTPLISKFLGTNGIYNITSYNIVKNEPFAQSQTINTDVYATPPLLTMKPNVVSGPAAPPTVSQAK